MISTSPNFLSIQILRQMHRVVMRMPLLGVVYTQCIHQHRNKTTKTIYMHEVEDGQLWDAEKLCKTTKDGTELDATSFVFGLD